MEIQLSPVLPMDPGTVNRHYAVILRKRNNLTNPLYKYLHFVGRNKSWSFTVEKKVFIYGAMQFQEPYNTN